jgi:hypothetical protein
MADTAPAEARIRAMATVLAFIFMGLLILDLF